LRDELSAIGWQAAATACQQMVDGHWSVVEFARQKTICGSKSVVEIVL
jgi:hypothetical protein